MKFTTPPTPPEIEELPDIKDWYNNQDGPKVLEIMRAVDVILGYDIETGNEFLAYGREFVSAIAKGNETVSVSVFRSIIRQSTQELEMFLAAVNVAKGHDDYQSSADALEIQELERLFSLQDGMHKTDLRESYKLKGEKSV
jgi:hypothetical protein